MGWCIKCTDATCGKQSWADNIVNLIANHRDGNGWFVCSCGRHGYIEKRFEVQEKSGAWEPFLRGIISLGASGDIYQPFVFLVSYEPSGEVTDVWYSYYKDLRSSGGRLKLGYGPGGPPVLGKGMYLNLLTRLVATGCVTKQEVMSAVGSGEPTSGDSPLESR